MFRVKKISFFLFFFLITNLIISQNINIRRHNPHIKWKQIEAGTFLIIYPPKSNMKKKAEEILCTLQNIEKKLNVMYESKINEKIKVVLTDYYDYFYFKESCFPFNQIILSLRSPEPENPRAHKEWLECVLANSMTKIFIVNYGNKLRFILKKIFGKLPFYFPMLSAPRWFKEGVAAHFESNFSKYGINKIPNYLIILKNSINKNSYPPKKSLSGEHGEWPFGMSRKIYGTMFFKFIKEKHKIKLSALFKQLLNKTFHFSTELSIEEYLGKKISLVWKEFIEYQKKINLKNNFLYDVKRLTYKGLERDYIKILDDKNLIYYQKDYKSSPAIKILNTKTLKQEVLIKDENILSIDQVNKNGFTYSTLEQTNPFEIKKNSFFYSFKKKKRIKLSKIEGLHSPIIDKNIIYCIQSENAQSRIIKINEEKQIEPLSKKFENLKFLTLSPDKTKIAVSLKEKNKNWVIAIFSTQGTLLEQINTGGVKQYQSKWISNEELYFICEYQKSYRIAYYKIGKNKIKIYDDKKIPSIKHFDTNNKNLYAIIFDNNGYNISKINISNKEFILKEKKDDMPNQNIIKEADQYQEIKYSHLEDFKPKYVNFTYRIGSEQLQPGLSITGFDPLYKHYTHFSAYTGTKNKFLNYKFNYILSIIKPILSFNFAKHTIISQKDYQYNEIKYKLKNYKMNIALYWQLLKKNKKNIYIGTEYFSQKSNRNYHGYYDYKNKQRNGFRGLIFFDSSAEYLMNISKTEGTTIAFSISQTIKSLGSNYKGTFLTGETRIFKKSNKNDVVALRMGLGTSWGKDKNLFYMGGNYSHLDYLNLARQDMFKLNRGFPNRYITGNKGYIINFEYRKYLKHLNKTKLLDKNILNSFLTGFIDIGELWAKKKNGLSPAISLGVEFNINVYYGELFTVSFGVAKGINKKKKSPTFYIRVGEAF